jgi:type 1 glutamine amidotransferase
LQRTLATAAAVVTAALVVAPPALAQPDTTAPVLDAATLAPVSAVPQRNGNPPNAPSTSTGNNNWFTQAGPTVLTVTATDNVGVVKLEYSSDNGATYTEIPITAGPSVTGTASLTHQGNVTVRYRATDAAGNTARGVAANTTLNQAAAAGATAVRLQSTNGRSAGDELAINTGDNGETVQIASVISPNPPSPAPNVNLATPLTKAHAAGTAVVATPMFRTIAVPIDTQAPTASLPASVVDNRIGHSQVVTPNRTDPTPGSGQTAVRDTWLDGTWAYPLPLDASQLSLGKHTWEVGVNDNAGNASRVKFTFLVTTSFADIDALLTRWGTAGTLDADAVTALRAKLSAAKAASDADDAVAAIGQLEAFVAEARTVSDAKARDLLITDGQELIRVERGLPDPAVPSDLGTTSTPYPGAPRHPYVRPAMPSSNPNATFRVLVISQRSDGFRHPAIEDGHVLIQQLGKQHGFDVDVWDYSYPEESLNDTPFTSAADLAKYKVIIGNSSVGLNTFRTAYTMKDGTVVNEQEAFEGYIRNGGGFVAIHGADDSMRTWPFYRDMLGGTFRAHPGNAGGFGTDCGSCYWAELITEDNTHPATAGFAKRFSVADELYQFDRKPRPYVHPLLLLNEDTYRTGIGVTGTGAVEGGDHPITYCSNYKGGRMFAQVLGHNWQLFTDTPWFEQTIREAIFTTAGLKPANCVTHREVGELVADELAAGGLTAAAAASATDLVNAAYDKYATLQQSGYSSSLTEIDALRALAQDPASGTAASRAKLLAKAQELKDWMGVLLGSVSAPGGPSGVVPATLSLSLGSAATFGAFTPGVARTYTAGTTANVISTAGDATLSVADPSATATGRLVNGSFSLATPLQANATSALGAGGALAAVGGSSNPTSLLTYSGPASNDAVTLSFSQSIGANEALRTGSYSKSLTFTLSTTTP